VSKSGCTSSTPCCGIPWVMSMGTAAGGGVQSGAA
jgi:hypothetical protein